MPARVKLCAIAKDEGPYVADWVFHHLHLGFEAVEVWVNGSTDGTAKILRRIGAAHPQVVQRNADRLLQRCLESGEHFQQKAYAKLARRAKQEGFSHVAFLDLDELWTPRDGVTPVTAFVPDEASDVNVVSFPWFLDVPDHDRAPFSHPWTDRVGLQADRHVKSVVRFDGRVQAFREHTARTTGGTRLLVRDPFPLEDVREQRSGAFVTQAYLAAHGGVLPEAFVLHAVNRSHDEYLATLTKGLRQTGHDLELKTNRIGYLTTAAPLLTWAPPPRVLRAYHRARRRFLEPLGLEPLVRRAQEQALARAEALAADVARDPARAAALGEPLRGTRLEQPAVP